MALKPLSKNANGKHCVWVTLIILKKITKIWGLFYERARIVLTFE